MLPHVVLYAQRIGTKFHLMHDNARAHKARATREALEKAGWYTDVALAQSPDLNLMGNMWDSLCTQCTKHKPTRVQ